MKVFALWMAMGFAACSVSVGFALADDNLNGTHPKTMSQDTQSESGNQKHETDKKETSERKPGADNGSQDKQPRADQR